MVLAKDCPHSWYGEPEEAYRKAVYGGGVRVVLCPYCDLDILKAELNRRVGAFYEVQMGIERINMAVESVWIVTPQIQKQEENSKPSE